MAHGTSDGFVLRDAFGINEYGGGSSRWDELAAKRGGLVQVDNAST